jgi:hypothetical protein
VGRIAVLYLTPPWRWLGAIVQKRHTSDADVNRSKVKVFRDVAFRTVQARRRAQ